MTKNKEITDTIDQEDNTIEDTSIDDTSIEEIKIKQLKKEIESLKEVINKFREANNGFLYAALAKAQSEMPIVQKANKSFANQKFASLADMVKFSRPILTKHGLSVTQLFESADTNVLVTRLCHSSGQFIESRIKLIIADSASKLGTLDFCKESGKAISYFSRYAYMCLVGLATSEDVY